MNDWDTQRQIFRSNRSKLTDRWYDSQTEEEGTRKGPLFLTDAVLAFVAVLDLLKKSALEDLDLTHYFHFPLIVVKNVVVIGYQKEPSRARRGGGRRRRRRRRASTDVHNQCQSVRFGTSSAKVGGKGILMSHKCWIVLFFNSPTDLAVLSSNDSSMALNMKAPHTE